jgi:hypothetical protein
MYFAYFKATGKRVLVQNCSADFRTGTEMPSKSWLEGARVLSNEKKRYLSQLSDKHSQ